ncbi:MAG: hypothetical protein JXA50_12115 [Deltaproteobacteria bacterium]|nr:hypothetical protein [Deltaproteobacteria bacterium]
MEGISSFTLIIIILLALFGASFFRTHLTRKGALKVIEIFYRHNALGSKNAKSLYELGLVRPDLYQRLFKRRDYKQTALRILIQKGLILANEEGNLYLQEENLEQSVRNEMNARRFHGKPS